MKLTPEERAERAAERAAKRAALREERRKDNRERWYNSPHNTNANWKARYEKEDQPLPEIAVEAKGSGSLAKLRAVMADPDSPIYRRLDAADVIIDFELAPGAAANVPPEQLASSAFQFYRLTEANPQTPEALKFRALKAIARIENSRKQAAQSPEAHFANREFIRRLINAERSRALREAGIWERVVESGAHWSLGPRDSFDPPILPSADVHASIEKDGSAEYLDACNRLPREQKEQFAAERTAILLAVRATNRVDDWERLLG
jgi:hypothetical protein